MADSITNGMISITQTEYTVGSALVYSCDSGFSTRDPTETVCEANSLTWSLDNSTPNCLRSCPDPDAVEDASLSVVRVVWLEGDEFTYICRDSLALNGLGINQCVESNGAGEWTLSFNSDNLPRCGKITI